MSFIIVFLKKKFDEKIIDCVIIEPVIATCAN